MSSGKKRKCLTLKERVEVIKTLEKHPGMKMQSLAELFGCGKTQIFTIIKKKDSTLSMYEANMPKTDKMGRN